jgi:hypothetical protein
VELQFQVIVSLEHPHLYCLLIVIVPIAIRFITQDRHKIELQSNIANQINYRIKLVEDTPGVQKNLLVFIFSFRCPFVHEILTKTCFQRDYIESFIKFENNFLQCYITYMKEKIFSFIISD